MTDTNATLEPSTGATEAVADATPTPSAEPAAGMPTALDTVAEPTLTPGAATANESALSAPDTSSTTDPEGAADDGEQPAKSETPPQDAPNWEKRYHDQLAYLARLARENADHRKYREQWGDLDPAQVRAEQERRAREAQALKLHPWHPQHPEHQRTTARLDRVQQYARQRDAILSDPELEPATRERLVRNLAQTSGIQQADIDLFRQHEEAVEEARVQMGRDPQGFITQTVAPFIRDAITQAVREYDEFQRVSSATNQWLNDPERRPILEKHGQDVLWAMDEKTPRREVGVTIAKLKAENEALRAKLGAERETVETAAAQQQALKARATVGRDLKTTAAPADPLADAINQNLSGVDLLDHLRRAREAQA
jgi:hypothetical protein